MVLLSVKSPIRWYGAKARLARHLHRLLPPHLRFVEGMAGSASTLLQKEPSASEVLNDLQADLMDFWAVVQNPDLVPLLIAALRVTSIRREEYEWCDRTYDLCADRVERARLFFVLSKLSFNGCFRAGWSDTTPAKYRSSFPNAVERLGLVSRRLQGVVLENMDFRALLAKYDAPDTCLYLDPPYIAATRKTKTRYQHEMSDFDHQELIRIVKSAKSSVVLSGYAHPIYDDHLRDWIRIEIPTLKHSAQGHSTVKPTAVEVVWIRSSRFEKSAIPFLPPLALLNSEVEYNHLEASACVLAEQHN